MTRVWGYCNYNGSRDLFCGTQKAFAAALGCSVSGLRPRMSETGNDGELRIARAHPNAVVHVPKNRMGWADITLAHVHDGDLAASPYRCETCERLRTAHLREFDAGLYQGLGSSKNVHDLTIPH